MSIARGNWLGKIFGFFFSFSFSLHFFLSSSWWSTTVNSEAKDVVGKLAETNFVWNVLHGLDMYIG